MAVKTKKKRAPRKGSNGQPKQSKPAAPKGKAKAESKPAPQAVPDSNGNGKPAPEREMSAEERVALAKRGVGMILEQYNCIIVPSTYFTPEGLCKTEFAIRAM